MPREWLLLLLARDALSAPGPNELDPVRIQKALFLLSMRGPARGLYSFRPYNWGPFSSAIYADLDRLEAEGLVQGRAVPGYTWRLYRPTEAGARRAQEFAETLDPSYRQWLAEARHFVTSRSFTRLLRDIYTQYPEYSVNSLLR